MHPGAALYDLTTNAPSVIRKIGERFTAKGYYLFDAPVSGGPKGANSGKLAIWIGGDEAVFTRHKPLLDAIGDQVRYVGPIGAGAVAKLVHNCASFAVRIALAEVMTLGVKAGVEPVALLQAVRAARPGPIDRGAPAEGGEPGVDPCGHGEAGGDQEHRTRQGLARSGLSHGLNCR